MEKKKINVCVKCGHRWKQRGKRKSKYCPSCHNPNWKERNQKEIIKLIVGDFFS
jgi:predicted RNA-binding Zn-ribbon protein involved in translation (DUF1610 family)